MPSISSMRSYSPENYQNFVKESCFTVYMNPWTKDECQSFVDGIGLNEDEWFHRFYLVGGKPRLLFSSSEEFDDLVQRVKDAIPENIDGLKEQVRLFQSQVFDGRMKHVPVRRFVGSQHNGDRLQLVADSHRPVWPVVLDDAEEFVRVHDASRQQLTAAANAPVRARLWLFDVDFRLQSRASAQAMAGGLVAGAGTNCAP